MTKKFIMDLNQLKKYCSEHDTDICKNIMRFINNSKYVNPMLLSRLNTMITTVQDTESMKVNHGSSSKTLFLELNSKKNFTANIMMLEQIKTNIIHQVKLVIESINSIITDSPSFTLAKDIVTNILKDINELMETMSNAITELFQYTINSCNAFNNDIKLVKKFCTTINIECSDLQLHLNDSNEFAWYIYTCFEYLQYCFNTKLTNIFSEMIENRSTISNAQYNTYLSYIKKYIEFFNTQSVNRFKYTSMDFKIVDQMIDKINKLQILSNTNDLPVNIDVDNTMLFNFKNMLINIDLIRSKLCKSAVDNIDTKFLSIVDKRLDRYFTDIATFLSLSDIANPDQLTTMYNTNPILFLTQITELVLQHVDENSKININNNFENCKHNITILQKICDSVIDPTPENILQPISDTSTNNNVLQFSCNDHYRIIKEILRTITNNNDYMNIVVDDFNQIVKHMINDLSTINPWNLFETTNSTTSLHQYIPQSNALKRIMFDNTNNRMTCTMIGSDVKDYNQPAQPKLIHYISSVAINANKQRMIMPMSKFLNIEDNTVLTSTLINIFVYVCDLYCKKYNIVYNNTNYTILMLSTYIAIYFVSYFNTLYFFIQQSLNSDIKNRNNEAIYALHMLINLLSTVLNNDTGAHNSGIFFGMNDNQFRTIVKECLYQNLSKTFAEIGITEDNTIKNFSVYTNPNYILNYSDEDKYDTGSSKDTNLYDLFVPCDFSKNTTIVTQDKYSVINTIAEFYILYTSMLHDSIKDNILANYCNDLNQLLLIDEYNKYNTEDSYASDILKNLKKYFVAKSLDLN